MIKSFINNIWFLLLNPSIQVINNRKYYLHHNSFYSTYGKKNHGRNVVYGYTSCFEDYDLKNLEKINNLYKLLLHSKHIFLRYNGGDFNISIYNKKYGWITYDYCDNNDCLNIHLYNYGVIYNLTYVYNLNKDFSIFLSDLENIEIENGTIKNVDFSE